MTGTKISISSRSCPFPPGCWLNSVTHVVGHSDVWFLTVIRPCGRLLWCQSSGLVLGHQSCRLLLCSPLLQVWLSAASEPLLGAWNPIDCSSCLLWSLDIGGGRARGCIKHVSHSTCTWVFLGALFSGISSTSQFSPIPSDFLPSRLLQLKSYKLNSAFCCVISFL